MLNKELIKCKKDIYKSNILITSIELSKEYYVGPDLKEPHVWEIISNQYVYTKTSQLIIQYQNRISRKQFDKIDTFNTNKIIDRTYLKADTIFFAINNSNNKSNNQVKNNRLKSKYHSYQIRRTGNILTIDNTNFIDNDLPDRYISSVFDFQGDPYNTNLDSADQRRLLIRDWRYTYTENKLPMKVEQRLSVKKMPFSENIENNRTERKNKHLQLVYGDLQPNTALQKSFFDVLSNYTDYKSWQSWLEKNNDWPKTSIPGQVFFFQYEKF